MASKKWHIENLPVTKITHTGFSLGAFKEEINLTDKMLNSQNNHERSSVQLMKEIYLLKALN